jgi:hypothetical protein
MFPEIRIAASCSRWVGLVIFRFTSADVRKPGGGNDALEVFLEPLRMCCFGCGRLAKDDAFRLRRRWLSVDDGAAIWMENLAGHITRIVGSEKEKAGCHFFRLPGAAERGVAAKGLNLFAGKGGWN